MRQLTDSQAVEYLHRCYTAADGLWFMKVEERQDFDTALDIDVAVWQIMPKIQARTLKTMIAGDGSIEHLRACLADKLDLDGFEFSILDAIHGFRIVIQRCPWHDIMKKGGREHLSDKVGNRICTTEYSAWAAEFDDRITCTIHSRICSGCDSCVIEFTADTTRSTESAG